jgi:hypothetical protein
MDPEIPFRQPEQEKTAPGVDETLGTTLRPSKKSIRSGRPFSDFFFAGFRAQTDLKNSAENKSSVSRSVQPPEFSAFPPSPLACRTLLSQHPRFLSAIDWPDAAHTRQGRTTCLQRGPKASSSSLALEHTKATKERLVSKPGRFDDSGQTLKSRFTASQQ